MISLEQDHLFETIHKPGTNTLHSLCTCVEHIKDCVCVCVCVSAFIYKYIYIYIYSFGTLVYSAFYYSGIIFCSTEFAILLLLQQNSSLFLSSFLSLSLSHSLKWLFIQNDAPQNCTHLWNRRSCICQNQRLSPMASKSK